MKFKDRLARVGTSHLARGTKHAYQTLLFLSGLFLLLAIVIMVLLRYVFKTNLFGMEEVILTVTFWFYFLGAVNGSMEDSQIRADLIPFFVKNESVKWRLRLFSRAIEIFVLVFMLVMTYGLLAINFRRMPTTQGLKIPYVIPQLSIFLGYALMLVYDVSHFLTDLCSKPAQKDDTNRESGGDPSSADPTNP